MWNLLEAVEGGRVHVKRMCSAQLSAEVARLPAALLGSRVRRVAVCDFLTRAFGAVIASAGADARAQAGGWHGEVSAHKCTVEPVASSVLQLCHYVVQCIIKCLCRH